METVQLIIFIALGAVLTEAVVNALEVFKGFNPSKEWFSKNWQYLIALLVAILAAVTYNLDFFNALGFDARIPYVGVVFTGIIISRGSNYANDIIDRVRAISQAKSSVTITAQGDGAVSSETAVSASSASKAETDNAGDDKVPAPPSMSEVSLSNAFGDDPEHVPGKHDYREVIGEYRGKVQE